MVKGLGETLVGAYPGRALSFVTKKSNLNAPQVNHLYLRADFAHEGYEIWNYLLGSFDLQELFVSLQLLTQNMKFLHEESDGFVHDYVE